MKSVLATVAAILAFTLALGLWLQGQGVVAPSLAGEGGLAVVSWPWVMPLFGALTAALIGIGNRRMIAEALRTGKIEKRMIRTCVALAFVPALALVIQSYVGLDHFGLTTKARVQTSFALLMVVFFLIMGNYATTLRPGSPGGLRTPWTMASDLVWRRTHRFLGRGLTLAALLGGAALILQDPRTVIYATMACVICIKMIAIAYSYLLWRERRPHPH